jgi:hypothetical protein
VRLLCMLGFAAETAVRWLHSGPQGPSTGEPLSQSPCRSHERLETDVPLGCGPTDACVAAHTCKLCMHVNMPSPTSGMSVQALHKLPLWACALLAQHRHDANNLPVSCSLCWSGMV